MKGRNVAGNTFKIRFYTKDANKNGLLPLMVRITVNGERSDCRAHDEVPPELWLPKAGMAAGRTTLANQINNNIRNITVNLTNIYNRLFLAGEQITAEKIRNEHLGRTHSDHTLLAIFREHNDREQKLLDVGRRAKSSADAKIIIINGIPIADIADTLIQDIADTLIQDIADTLIQDMACERLDSKFSRLATNFITELPDRQIRSISGGKWKPGSHCLIHISIRPVK